MPIDWLRLVVIFLVAPGLLLLIAVVIGFGIHTRLRPSDEPKKGHDE